MLYSSMPFDFFMEHTLLPSPKHFNLGCVCCSECQENDRSSFYIGYSFSFEIVINICMSVIYVFTLLFSFEYRL